MTATQPQSAGPSRDDWARAYARQAGSDWELYTLLEEQQANLCHRVHYLQMASEKIAKAYRFRDTDTPVEQLLRHHVGFTKFFNQFLRSDRVLQMYQGKNAQHRELIKRCNALAREVEALAPAADRHNRPANPEYPWQHGLEVFIPHDHDFPNLKLLEAPAGRNFLKLLKLSILEFESIGIR